MYTHDTSHQKPINNWNAAKKSGLPFAILLLLCLFLFLGCSQPARGNSSEEPPVYSPLKVLVPEAPGREILGNAPLLLDVSNLNQGYLVAQADTGIQGLNLQLLDPEQVTYSYFIHPGEQAVIPLTGGEGTYLVTVYEQIEGDQYAALYTQQLEVTLENSFLPYLYPNQYVNFTPDSQASRLALELLPQDASDIDALAAIYDYVVENITYDEDKAQTVEAGYLPDVDETLRTGTGICFDYAALMTAMLRSRDIPCKLQIGYSSNIKHAWIDVYIRSKGWIEQAIAFDGEQWSRLDPTFDSTSQNDDAILDYIGDGSNYTLQFTR
ncbi:MAG: transglutaminase-like domain-containing protein [Blautia sp.]|jgi:hypothetical protein